MIVPFLMIGGGIVFVLEISLLPVSRGWGPFLSILAGLAAIFGPLGLAVLVSHYDVDEPDPKKALFAVSLYGIVGLTFLLSPLVGVFASSWSDYASRSVSVPVVAPISKKEANGHPLFAVLSDSHITDKPRTLEGHPHGEQKLQGTLTLLQKISPKVAIIAGDLTDQGDPKEWSLVTKLLHEKQKLDQSYTLLLPPGNHDLQGSPYDKAGNVLSDIYLYDEPKYKISYLERVRSYVLFAQAQEGWLTTIEGVPLSKSQLPQLIENLRKKASLAKLEVYEDEPMNPLRPTQRRIRYYKSYPAGFSEELEKVLEAFQDLFPLVYEDRTAGMKIVLLNSSAIVRPGGDMGLGDLGSRQIARLESYLTRSDTALNLTLLLVVIHHPPVRREADTWSWEEMIRTPSYSDIWAHTFLSMDGTDSKQLLRLLEGFLELHSAVNVVITHGHRHGKHLGRTSNGLLIVEAPSVIESSISEPGFWVGYFGSDGLNVKWQTP